MTDQELLSHFERQGPGQWTTIKPFQVGGVSMGPGVSFTRGVSMSGVDMAAELDAAAARLGR